MRENTMFNLPATEHHIEREQRLFDYLVKELNSNILINLATHIWISLKMKVWNISKQILEVPDCSPNSDGSRVTFTWDRDEHYLECEINIEGEADFFYRNRLTKETWGYTYDSSNPKFPDSEWLLDKLILFTE